MKPFLIVVASFFALILQSTVFNVLSVAGGKPDFLLLFVVFYAIFRGPLPGGVLGLALGLMEDLMVGRFIGLNAICKGLIGYAVGSAEKRLYKDNFFVPIAALVVASFVNSIFYGIVSNLIGSSITVQTMVLNAIPNGIYNMFFAPVIYAIFYRIHHHSRQD